MRVGAAFSVHTLMARQRYVIANMPIWFKQAVRRRIVASDGSDLQGILNPFGLSPLVILSRVINQGGGTRCYPITETNFHFACKEKRCAVNISRKIYLILKIVSSGVRYASWLSSVDGPDENSWYSKTRQNVTLFWVYSHASDIGSYAGISFY